MLLVAMALHQHMFHRKLLHTMHTTLVMAAWVAPAVVVAATVVHMKTVGAILRHTYIVIREEPEVKAAKVETVETDASSSIIKVVRTC